MGTTIHISQAEAERDLHSLLARVDDDVSFVIENGSHPIAVLQAPPSPILSFAERLALLPKDSEAVMDDSFAHDIELGIAAHRAPLDTSILTSNGKHTRFDLLYRCRTPGSQCQSGLSTSSQKLSGTDASGLRCHLDGTRSWDHGADTPLRAALRRKFLDEVATAADICPVTQEIAIKAGLIGGDLTSKGIHVAEPDLLIGVTALELGYSIITHNVRHFNRIPGLNVIAQ